jgi:hypothetical protein
MSFTGNGISSHGVPVPGPPAAFAAASSSSSSGQVATSAVGMSDEEQDLVVGEVDDALAMLLSLGEAEQARVQVAVQTVTKMLHNLLAHPQDMKYRSIRLANPVFQSKVGQLCGGVELLVAAGFGYSGLDENCAENCTSSPRFREDSWEAPSCLSADRSSASGFLIHTVSPLTLGRLEYTLSRLQELLDIQAQAQTAAQQMREGY